MKRFFAILFIALLLVGVSVAEELLLKHAVENIESHSHSLAVLISENEGEINTEEIKEARESLESFWNNEEKMLCYFISYDKIKNVSDSLQKMKYAIEKNDVSLAIENVSNIQNYSHFLYFAMGFNLSNLF